MFRGDKAKSPYKLPKVFEIRELKRLFGVVNEPLYMMAYLLGFFCGLRIGELCKLKVEDIDIYNRVLSIKDSKNPNRSVQGYGKDRNVAIPKPLIPLLDKWLQYIGGSKYLFPMRLRLDKQYNISVMRKKFNSHLEKAGIRTSIGFDSKGRKVFNYRFHTLRHTYATYLYNKGMDLLAIGKMLGHTDNRATQIYTHIGIEKEKVELDKIFI
ncbi:MAG: tyrosine-type recombinase/integrase [Candidatus Nanoarchaeia archaeon]